MPRNNLRFDNLWYGRIVNEDANTYNAHHLVDQKVFQKLLDNFGINIISKADVKGKYYRYTVKLKNGKRANAVFGSLRRSGELTPSRIKAIRGYVYPPVKTFQNSLDNPEEPLFFFGAYNSGDEILLTCTEYSAFVRRSVIERNYASFWVGSHDDLVTIYRNGQHFWHRKDRRTGLNIIFRGITLTKIQTMDYDSFVRRFFTVSNELPKEKKENIETAVDTYNVEPQEFDERYIHEHTSTYLSRNKDYRNEAIRNAHYTCEVCKKEHTFLTKNGVEYFDGHHLIMYNQRTQSRFDKSLDIPRNIICLCPECHKKIHYAQDEVIKDLLISLFMKHRELLDIYEINSLDEIFEDYNVKREEDL